MALRFINALLLFTAVARASVNEPFPFGFAMSTLGTIRWEDGVAGREPWAPAAFYRASSRFAFATCGVLYYDPMDNLEGRSINQFAVGGMARIDRCLLTVKAGYARFTAMGVYYEDTGFLSAATDALKFIIIGYDLRWYRQGILDGGGSRSAVLIGESLWFPFRFAALSFTCMHLEPGAADERLSGPPRYTVGIHTRQHRLGAQGVVLEGTMERSPSLSVCIGEEIRLHSSVALSGAIGANPLRISVGLTVTRPRWGAGGSLVYHPVLGWSKGMALQYVP